MTENERIEQLILNWAWARKGLVFDASMAAQAIEKRHQGYQPSHPNYRAAYKALCRLRDKDVICSYHANQHHPILWWLAQRDMKFDIPF